MVGNLPTTIFKGVKYVNKRNVRTLQKHEQVVFYVYNNIYRKKIPQVGTVLDVEDRGVWINWLEGYRDQCHLIPFTDMIAVYDENGEMMKWSGIEGKSVLLEY